METRIRCTSTMTAWAERGKFMTYEDICKRYGMNSMSDAELISRDYVKVDRFDEMDVYSEFAARYMTDTLAAKLKGKNGQEYITASREYFDNTYVEYDFGVFYEAAWTYVMLRWAVNNRIRHCTLFLELKGKVNRAEDGRFGTKGLQKLRAIWRKESEDEEEYKKTLPRRTDY